MRARIEGKELVGAEFDVPTEENAGDGGEAGEQDEDAADAVGGEQKVDAHGGDPGCVNEDCAALAYAGDEAGDGEREAGNSDEKREPAGEHGFAFGQQR